MPAVTVMVASVLVAGWFLLLPADYVDLGRSAIAQQAMAANVYFWRNTGYFDGAAELKPLLHMWSLAVEEQFYLGYPVLLWMCAPLRQRTTGLVMLALTIVSFGLSQYGIARYPSATFYLLPTRAWELALGGLLWFLPPVRSVGFLQSGSLGWISLATIVGLGWWLDQSTPFPGPNALPPCVATAILIHSNASGLNSSGRFLALRPLVFVGLLSYSLYLWHWPVLAFLRYRVGENLDTWPTVCAIAASSLLAVGSWKWVETPFRRGAILGSPRQSLAAAGGAAVAVLVASALVSRDGVPSRYSKEVLQIVQIPYAGRDSGATGTKETGWNLPNLGTKAQYGHPLFVLWGDSHAKCLGPLCDRLAQEQGIAGIDAGKGGTPPLLGAWSTREPREEATSFNEYVLEEAARKGIRWLILVAAWDLHIVGSHLRNENGLTGDRCVEQSFFRTLEAAERQGMRVAVLLQPPYQDAAVPPRVARDFVSGKMVSRGIDIEKHHAYQARSRQFFESLRERVVIVEAGDGWFDQTGKSVTGVDGVPYYSDGNHLSNEGVNHFYSEPLRAFFGMIAKTAPAAVQGSEERDGDPVEER
jgi:peptidoglycan/LPS O-acetylase OafA/YrhL